MTTISISEHEAIEQGMTAGEWTTDEETPSIYGRCDPDVLEVAVVSEEAGNFDADLVGICAMRNAYPALLAIARAALEWQMSPQEPARLARKRLLEALKAVRP